jgi:hypothetical protein
VIDPAPGPRASPPDMGDAGLDTDQVAGHPDLAILRAHEALEAGGANGLEDTSGRSELADDRLVDFPNHWRTAT